MSPRAWASLCVAILLVALGASAGYGHATETEREIGRAEVAAQACPLLLAGAETIADSVAVADRVPACWPSFPKDTTGAVRWKELPR